MSIPPSKRGAPESASPIDPKRMRTPASKTPEPHKLDGSFEISVEMEDRFHVYPKRLRELIEDRHEMLVAQVMAKFENDTPLQPRYGYAITRQRISQPENEASDYKNTRFDIYPAVSFANKEALKEFLMKVPAKKAKFVELKLEGLQPMRNPTFARLQTGRDGEISWGFDMHGCLSLDMTSIENCTLKHEKLFVERTGPKPIKRGEDDDCRVVPGPNATEV